MTIFSVDLVVVVEADTKFDARSFAFGIQSDVMRAVTPLKIGSARALTVAVSDVRENGNESDDDWRLDD